jgi:DeoR/GlpR family transcriptional regulator of sugar metabolism
MDATDRHQLILEQLAARGEVTVAEVSHRVGASAMTIRRDLDELDRLGAVERVRGGAVSVLSRGYEPPFGARAKLHVEAKEQIAAAAAQRVHGGQTVVLDAGTTTLALARRLRGIHGLTIATLSLRIASALADERDMRVIIIGGVVRAGEHSVVSSHALEHLSQLRFDLCFLTISGVEARSGLTEWNLDDAATKTAAIGSSRECVVLADASKLGKVAFARVAALDRVDLLITDAAAPADQLALLRGAGLSVLAAGVETP